MSSKTISRRLDALQQIADRPEYTGAAGVMTVLCHPVPNRKVPDYE